MKTFSYLLPKNHTKLKTLKQFTTSTGMSVDCAPSASCFFHLPSTVINVFQSKIKITETAFFLHGNPCRGRRSCSLSDPFWGCFLSVWEKLRLRWKVYGRCSACIGARRRKAEVGGTPQSLRGDTTCISPGGFESGGECRRKCRVEGAACP